MAKSSIESFHVIFPGHTLGTATALCIERTAGWSDSGEEKLKHDEGAKHAKKYTSEEFIHSCFSFRIVLVSLTKVKAIIELCSLPPPPPPPPLLLHHHPLPHARPLLPLHLLLPLRILMLGTVTTPSLVHILKIVHQPFVSLCHLKKRFLDVLRFVSNLLIT